MIAHAATTSRRAVRAASIDLTRIFAPGWVLSTLVLVSAASRSVVAWRHPLPRYFPDEYIYASLGRSLAHGRLSVHGLPAHFPALLEPILAAPLWGSFSIQTAYHLVQMENAIAGSLVVIPVYLLARTLRLPRGYSYLCCVFAVSLPLFVASAFVVTDFVAYPLVLASMLMGVKALTEPTPKRQLAFLGVVALTIFGRTQYFVFVPAYLVAAAFVDGRTALRRHWVTALAMAPAVIVVLVGSLGFYRIGRGSFEPAIATWIPLEGFLLAVAAGIVIVPGAIAGILRPGERTRAAFGALAGVFSLALMAEVSVFAAQEGQFRERYLFAILPLVPLGFGIYLERGRPYRRLVLGISAALALAAMRLPLSQYATNARFSDSQTLIAVEWLQDHWSAGSSSLLIALLITTGAAGACMGAFRRGRQYVAVPVAICALLAATVGATRSDMHFASINRPLLPRNLSWIDDAAGGNAVTVVETPASSGVTLLVHLFWNPNASRELVAPGGVGTDPYATDDLRVGRDGTLAGVGRYFLFDSSGSQATFINATRVASQQAYDLYRTGPGGARFRTYFAGLLTTGWTSPDGRIRAYAGSGRGTRITFRLALPNDLRTVEHVEVGNLRFTLRPGRSVVVSCASGGESVNAPYSVRPVLWDSLGRPVGVQASKVTTSDTGRSAGPASSTTSCRLLPR
jgi:hypothetical protein